MNEFQTISPKELHENPFTLFREEWALLTAGDGLASYNPMTVAWGGVGIIWNKNTATIYVRPQRYTFGLLEQSAHYTLSFFGGECRDALSFCGSKSGRDCDKAKECGLTPVELGGGVAFEEARLVLACQKLYWSDLDPTHFLDPGIDAAQYPLRDYHRLYIGEIMTVYVKPQ